MDDQTSNANGDNDDPIISCKQQKASAPHSTLMHVLLHPTTAIHPIIKKDDYSNIIPLFGLFVLTTQVPDILQIFIPVGDMKVNTALVLGKIAGKTFGLLLLMTIMAYLLSYMTSWVNHMLKGQLKSRQIRYAQAWACAPFAPILFLQVTIFTIAIICTINGLHKIGLILYVVYMCAHGAAVLWGLFLYILFLKQLSQFSIMRTLAMFFLSTIPIFALFWVLFFA